MREARAATFGSVGLHLLAAAIAACAACTLTHPLDSYGADRGDDAGNAADAATGSPDAATDAGSDEGVPDGGDGCMGVPTILSPANGATVPASVHLTASSPSCLTTMILYVDSQETLRFGPGAIDQDVPVTVGSHRLNINGWAGTALAHKSSPIMVTRTK